MSCFDDVSKKKYEIKTHPWESTIKDKFSAYIKNGHNSINNPPFKPKKQTKTFVRSKFTIIGNRVSKEFIYCAKLITGLCRYKKNHFDVPVIRGLSTVEWPIIFQDLKLKYGGLAYCIPGDVVILIDDQFLGGQKELRNLIEAKYNYYIYPDFYNEGIKEFINFVDNSGRPCVYMHITIDGDDKFLGTLIFMLYADIVPLTCENFMRLCKEKRGGYSGTPVHRIVKGGWIQCGGYGLKSTSLDCENFILTHDRRGVLCMANDGRHIDCSTQFFVLLQPAPWMENKYVAFGQLINGEETLQRIENVPTWYESPTSEINILEAGILNLHCQDLIVNKGTYEYIYNHIENLTEVEEMLREFILETLYAALTAKELARLQEEEEESGGDRDRRNVRAAKRFLRKKEDIDKQLRSGTLTVEAESFIEDDFFVDDYEASFEYESEESFPLSPAPEVKPKPDRWVYFPLADVPYPGEVDSTHDLKKFIKGHYCLESDLLHPPPDEDVKEPARKSEKLTFSSEVFQFDQSDESEDISFSSLDSDEEKEIRRYIKLNVDRISFAGDIIKGIVRGVSKHNIFEDARKSELITDEDLRKFRLVSMDHRSKEQSRVSPEDRHSREEKKVSILVPEIPKSHERIRRRPTGFPRPEIIEKILKSKESILLEEEPQEPRKVSIVVPETFKPFQKKIRRRPTGFPRPETLEKAKGKEIATLEDDEILDPSAVQTIDSRKVRIAPNVRSIQASEGRQTVSQYSADSDVEVRRRSVLTRLMNDLTNTDETGPTLKDYKPFSEMNQGNPLLTLSTYLAHKSEDNDDKYFRPSFKIETPSFDRVMNIQHGKKMVRKVSSDYVKTLGQIEEEFESSIRSIEFAKKRPSLSISQYQRKNLSLRENVLQKALKKVGYAQSASKKPTHA